MAGGQLPVQHKKTMTSGNTDLVVRRAVLADLDVIKIIADQNKNELGFIVRRALERSIEGNEMLVAVDDSDRLSGFLQYHHRRDGYITLYNIAVQFGSAPISIAPFWKASPTSNGWWAMR